MRLLPFTLVCLLPLLVAGQSPQDAKALEDRGDWAGAAGLWKSLTQAHPDDYRYWTSLGIALAHQNHFPEAIDAYQKALVLHPGAGQTQFNLGLAYFKSGDLEKAIPPLKDSAAQLPGVPQIDLLLGMSLYGTGKYTEATPYLERAEARDSENKELRFVLAQTYLWGGEYEKAKREFQTMLERDPDSAQVHMLLGEAYDGLGKTDHAISEFQTAAKQGALPDAHFGLGYLLWKVHRYPDAVPEFRSELIINSKNYKALAYLGDTELKLGQLTSAKHDLSAALSLDDALWITQYDLGRLEENENHYQSAIKHYKRAAELDPERAEPHYRLAQLLKAQGDQAGARAEFAAVARLHARSSDDLILKITGNKPETSHQ